MKILKRGEDALSTVAIEVPHGENVTELATEMKRIMVHAKGCGIAANQVGVLKRIIIISTDKYMGTIINPVITESKYLKISKKEGCLSVPNYRVDMHRFNHVVVEGFDLDWNPIKIKLKALSAFAVQHEIDHLNGITIKG